MRKKLVVVGAVAPLVSAFLLTGTPATAAAPAPATGTTVRADFNNDGIADLAVGAPLEDSAVADSGAVNVIYGSVAGGLRVPGNQVWTQDSAGIAGVAEAGDQFGASIAAGDFNGDGITDLAVGVPLEDFAATNDGGVNVIYGAPGGLTSAGNQFWSQDTAGVGGVAEANDQFGRTLAAGNLGLSLHDDLAVGTPLEDSALANSGAVNVIYGSAAGLAAANNQVWTQDSAGIGGVAEANDQFGSSLAIGDFGNSVQQDLAIGVPLEDLAATDDGVVNVVYGAAAGLTSAGNQVWGQDNAGIGGVAEANDQFGRTLAAGNLGLSVHDDLAVGTPLEDSALVNSGAVNTIYGSGAGLSAAGNQVWTQDSAGIGGVAEANDQFGFSLAIGELGSSAQEDLAIGVPLEDLAATDDGVVNVIYGAAAGLAAAGNQVWGQDNAGIAGVAEAGDQFGRTLIAANFGRSANDDLAVGVQLEDSALANSGAVNAIYGTAAGLAAANNQVWTQDTAGIGGVAEAGDQFGAALGADRD